MISPAPPSAEWPVLMICPQFSPIVGGYERAAQRLSSRLMQAGVRVSIVTLQFDPAWARREFVGGVGVTRIPFLHRRGFSTLTSIVSLSLFLLRHGRGFRIWHCHAPTPAVAVACLLGRVLGVKVIVKLSSSGAAGISRSARRGALGRLGLQPHLLRFAAAAIALTEQTANEAKAFFSNRTRVLTIPNGIDDSLFRPPTEDERLAARQSLGIAEETRLVLQVCRLEHPKNLPSLLQAWANLPPSIRVNSKLAIVGQGALMPLLVSEAARLGLADTLLLPGATDRVCAWYQAADVYVLSSLYEGLSNSLLEAMACGLPIVMTEVSGRELVADAPPAGLVVPVDDPERLTSALVNLLEDMDGRRVMGVNARRKIESGFGIDSVTQRTRALYDRLAGGRRGSVDEPLP